MSRPSISSSRDTRAPRTSRRPTTVKHGGPTTSLPSPDGTRSKFAQSLQQDMQLEALLHKLLYIRFVKPDSNQPLPDDYSVRRAVESLFVGPRSSRAHSTGPVPRVQLSKLLLDFKRMCKEAQRRFADVMLQPEGSLSVERVPRASVDSAQDFSNRMPQPEIACDPHTVLYSFPSNRSPSGDSWSSQPGFSQGDFDHMGYPSQPSYYQAPGNHGHGHSQMSPQSHTSPEAYYPQTYDNYDQRTAAHSNSSRFYHAAALGSPQTGNDGERYFSGPSSHLHNNSPQRYY